MAQVQTSNVTALRHPQYSTLAQDWKFFADSYNGGRDYLRDHLFRYFKEGEKEFSERVNRAYRENHCKKVVGIINSYLFKEGATRKTENTYLEDFFDNFDGKGKEVSRFMKRASVLSSVYGRVYIVVDKKRLPEGEESGTQADNLKTLPYCYMVTPLDVLDICFDDMGAIKWALIQEQKRVDADPFTATGEVRTFYRLWLPGTWILYNDGGQEIDRGETGLDCVPIVIVDNEEGDEYSGQSLIADIAYLDRAIFNNWSRLDVIVNDQTFSQLIFPIEGLATDIVDDDVEREKFIQLATNRVILYSAQAQAAPAFISPDASQATFILSMIERQVKQLYAFYSLQGETADETKAAASGASKAYDFDKLNKLLADKADNLEQAEREIVELFGKWLGDISIEAEIEYPDEFDVKSLADEIAIAQELTMLRISDTFTKEIQKMIVMKALPKMNQDTQKAIMDEIDQKNLSEEEAIRQGRFDFDGKPIVPGQPFNMNQSGGSSPSTSKQDNKQNNKQGDK